jgi:hypothetical protein
MTKSLILNESTYRSCTSLLLCRSVSKLEASQREIFDRGFLFLLFYPHPMPTSLLTSISISNTRGVC